MPFTKEEREILIESYANSFVILEYSDYLLINGRKYKDDYLDAIDELEIGGYVEEKERNDEFTTYKLTKEGRTQARQLKNSESES
jgi:hypothetical protein